MKLVVGLGNPGKKYDMTRHNMGYRVIDRLCEIFHCDLDHEKFKGVFVVCKHELLPEPVIFAKPETFMNLSGEFIRPLMDYYGIDIDDLIVIYDDMALPEGKVRLRYQGSSGSHNGMRNIIENLKSESFKRVRVGIGEPQYGGIDYVLSKPTGESARLADEAVEKAAEATRDALIQGFTYAMNHYN